jgi:hypothetical protein
MRALRQFVTQVRHRNVRTILLKQAVNPVLPASAALVAHEAHHLLFGRSLTQRVRTGQLSRRSARSICAVALLMSASSPLVAAMSTSSRRMLPMRPYLPPGPHVPHEPGSVFEGRQLDPRPLLRLDDAGQL